jgi:hypothetical protein
MTRRTHPERGVDPTRFAAGLRPFQFLPSDLR